MPQRTIAIGDIHGCASALAALLKAIQPTADDVIIPLGDYVDRGPDSRCVIDLLIGLVDQCQLIPLLGNHEVMLLDACQSIEVLEAWLEVGGRETLASYGGSLDEMPVEHRVFLQGLRRYHETETHMFVHANYHDRLPLMQQPDRLLLWEHIVRWIPKPHVSGKTVIVGHTPQGSGEILDLGFVKCIDTYCVGGGWLTALDVESGIVWQANRDGELRHDG